MELLNCSQRQRFVSANQNVNCWWPSPAYECEPVNVGSHRESALSGQTDEESATQLRSTCDPPQDTQTQYEFGQRQVAARRERRSSLDQKVLVRSHDRR